VIRCTRSRRTSTARSRCSSGCSSSTTRSRLPWRSGGARSDPARTRGLARADPHALPGRERPLGSRGIGAGLGFGVLLSRGLALYISGLIAGVYGLAERTTEIATEPRLMLFGLLMGVTTSVVAGSFPRGTHRGSTRSRPCRKAATRSCRPARTACGGSPPPSSEARRRPCSCSPAVDGALLLGLRHGRARSSAAEPDRRALADAGAAAVAEPAQAGGGRARRRQPDQAPRRTSAP